jgi:hypothetical protein
MSWVVQKLIRHKTNIEACVAIAFDKVAATEKNQGEA